MRPVCCWANVMELSCYLFLQERVRSRNLTFRHLWPYVQTYSEAPVKDDLDLLERQTDPLRKNVSASASAIHGAPDGACHARLRQFDKGSKRDGARRAERQAQGACCCGPDARIVRPCPAVPDRSGHSARRSVPPRHRTGDRMWAGISRSHRTTAQCLPP